MKKLKMPLPYLSYSAFDLYLRDPIEFYKQYYVGRVDSATPKMVLGKVFQEAWSDPKYDYAEELRKAGFTADAERAVRTALTHPQTVRLKKSKCEKEYTVQGRGLKYPIKGIFDGEDREAQLIVENKFGAPWNQYTVNKSKQLTWYILITTIKHGYTPKVLLQSFNSKNGLPTHFWVTRSVFELDKLVNDINKVVERIESADFGN